MRDVGDTERPAGQERSWAGVALDSLSHPVLLLDQARIVLDCGASLLTAMGARRADVVGRPLDVAALVDAVGHPSVRAGKEHRRQVREAITAAAGGRCCRVALPEGAGELTATPVPRSGGAGSGGLGSHDADPAESLILIEIAAPLPAARVTAPRADPTEQPHLALRATGLGVWEWDLASDVVTWSPRPQGTRLTPVDGPGLTALMSRVAPADRGRLLAELREVASGRALLDVEFRAAAPDQPERWWLARGQHIPGAAGEPGRVVGVVLDITGRALARSANDRLLRTERRSSRRAHSLQRVAAALSEAATCEQVAAVMVEESLRSLGAKAARIEVHPPDGGSPGAPRARGATKRATPDVVRTAGAAALLAATDSPVVTLSETGAPHSAGARSSGGVRIETGAGGESTLVTLELTVRAQQRGRWILAWPVTRRPDVADPHSGPRWSATDWTAPDGIDLLRTLATECAQALDRAELYEQQRDIATVLQRTLLPSVLPEVSGAQVAARYQPGGQGVDVGGDWYDVISLPAGRTALVIGDVEGHSAAAAGVMGQVRNALRAYAVEGSTPPTVMERVNRLLTRLQVTQLVSCCYVEFAPADGTATVVLAGHPPPLLVHPGSGGDYVAAHPNLMLGVDDTARYVETTLLLDPGVCLLLYTDGLVETGHHCLSEGLATLRGWASEGDEEESPEELVERLIRRAREGAGALDDVAVLAMRYQPPGRVPPSRFRTVRRTFPLDPASPAAARRLVGDVLAQWGLQQLSHPVMLMTSELVTNSVLHTGGELALSLRLDADRLRVEVIDHSERLPTLQTPDSEAAGGRGLLIVDALADRWGVDVRGDGKAVWFELHSAASGNPSGQASAGRVSPGSA